MAISVSAVLLLLIIVIVMLRGGTLRPLPALAATLFGFFLASTGIAPSITNAFSSMADALHSINF
ncbi:hypothetical protein HUT19_42020 (plasmid) [Streptomyces sp. NA02950]|uniref:hypothetical protein n=1 Tax=Streptomyces sp. NA02950 TaxID=2742137 RepID=UPI00159231B0|nr:hypothetical protein [Streptomyces sp. NA02950]QKV98296.1 hypothetical protein HUT19_42020 [Streptomyces sp. NA02950]